MSFGALCAGTVLSWTSPALPLILQDDKTPINATKVPPPGFKITEEEGALVGAMLTIGALISAIPVGYFADKFGRKRVILALVVPFLLNWLLIIFAENVNMLVAGRFFAGVALGGVCVVAPMYIGEIAEASYRGIFGSFFQMFLCSGILLTCIIGSMFNWTSLAAILLFVPLIFGFSFIFMPETPTYLIRANNILEAEKTLKRIRGSNYDITGELKEIQRQNEEFISNKMTIKDVLSSRANLRAIISVVGVLGFQQLSGINAVVFYAAPIFKAAGSSLSPSLAAIIINLVQMIVAYISILVIEKADRRIYLLFSSTGMLLCLASLGMYFHIKRLDVHVNIDFLPLTSIILFMVFFSLGFGPIGWMLMSELFSPEIKGIASGIAVLANWVFAFLVTFSFPLMTSNLGEHVTFYIFSCIMACGTVFVYFVVPETRGKSLAEIQQVLNR